MPVPSHTEILQSLRTYCTDNFLYMKPDFVLRDEDKLLESGVLDSMGVMELIGFLEERFGVTPKDDEITEQNMGSLLAIAELVGRKLAH
jgi:acyl carrier protein